MNAPIGIVGSRLSQRRRRWTNIEPTMGECLVFARLLVGWFLINVGPIYFVIGHILYV